MAAVALTKTLKSFVKAHLPRAFNVGPAVVQLFLNDGRETSLSLLNFPAFLAPKEAQAYEYRVWVYDEDGHEKASTRVSVAPFGAVDVNLRERFGSQLPAFGMVAVRIEPTSLLSFRDGHLGRIRSHFFALYSDRDMNSIGLVHPQTSLGSPVDSQRRWVSNLRLDPRRLRKLEMFQVNPSRESVTSEAFLQSEEDEVLATHREAIPSYGTRRAVFDIESIESRCAVFSVGLHGLAAANGKPILFLHYRDGSFSCCHA